ncbi:dihydroorotate dehydrogenase (quinone) isoform X2 [Bacillus rossius redtenbacheri]|uniref:dihydroorotate dehydrogenase (quinone) isoform X2 n=2 Tax=Bacillus rossius redtenbacheri TaxID=93214 RepID=UPI002FDED840
MSPRNRFLYKLRSMVVVTGGALGLCSAVSVYRENERFYDGVVVPLLSMLDPETAHNAAVVASKWRLVPPSRFTDPDSLHTRVWHLKFSNPVGLAAGFDKHGEVVEAMHGFGFGFVEVGSVTPRPQPGNDRPRVFRLPDDQAIINRYGFNSEGHDAVHDRISSVKASPRFPGVVGINLGKNRDAQDPVGDYVKGIKKFGAVADYLVINISSPNTPGLRGWQSKERLAALLGALVSAHAELSEPRPPLLLKLAPDLGPDERRDVAEVLRRKECRVDGLVISNTTVERAPSLHGPHVAEEGGLSGRPLCDQSTAMIAEMYRLTDVWWLVAGRLPIIGVGGVFSGRDAYDKILAGASLVQLYTSFVYHGPPRVTRVKRELDQLLRADGLSHVSEAVGRQHTLTPNVK